MLACNNSLTCTVHPSLAIIGLKIWATIIFENHLLLIKHIMVWEMDYRSCRRPQSKLRVVGCRPRQVPRARNPKNA